MKSEDGTHDIERDPEAELSDEQLDGMAGGASKGVVESKKVRAGSASPLQVPNTGMGGQDGKSTAAGPSPTGLPTAGEPPPAYDPAAIREALRGGSDPGGD